MPRITDEHIAHWHRHGWVIVPEFLTVDELGAARADVGVYLPTWDEMEASPHRYASIRSNPGWAAEFPYAGDALNDLTTHPELVGLVERELGTDDLELHQSLLWGKYAGTHDFEQSLHADYRNNTLVHPRDDGIFRQVPFILYLSDVGDDMGPTRVVSQERTTGESVAVNRRPPATHEELYEHEQAVTVRAGSLLIYSMQTFHRGSAITASAGARFTLHVVYRAAASRWMSWRGWARYADGPEMSRFMARATPRERCLLGFPAPGHPYWNDEMIDGVAVRYPGMDMAPYRDALAVS